MKETDSDYLKDLKNTYFSQLDIKSQTLYSEIDAKHYIFFSDIHGNANTISLIDHAQFDFNDSLLVGGGDYVDGRKNSKFVIETMAHFAHYSNSVILKGNHEQMMIDFADGGDPDKLWYFNGGKTTMRSLFGHQNISYKEGMELLKNSSTYKFLQSMPIMLVTPNYIFCHAGVIPNKKFDDPSQYGGEGLVGSAMENYDSFRMWARQEYFSNENYPRYFRHNETGKTIVTGHTPTALVTGWFDDGRVYEEAPFIHCCVRPIQYEGEPARILTDNGCHSRYPTHDGNVTVLDDKGNIIAVYDYRHPHGIEWSDYKKENQLYLPHQK